MSSLVLASLLLVVLVGIAAVRSCWKLLLVLAELLLLVLVGAAAAVRPFLLLRRAVAVDRGGAAVAGWRLPCRCWFLLCSWLRPPHCWMERKRVEGGDGKKEERRRLEMGFLGSDLVVFW